MSSTRPIRTSRLLTARWKAGLSGENQVHAALQAARDGALIVNYKCQFYLRAYPERCPSQLETCHFSATTETYTCILWIHWRESGPNDDEVYLRMEEVETARMNKLHDLQELRKRLRSIKEALHEFWPNRPETKVKKTQSQSSMTDNICTCYAVLGQAFDAFK
ncbi:hypothetical protein UVI_02061970 [Ustilaginoidea virens]|uniref:Uncharacterized protein n=1 Tax=Ustilaginoidea virens TaxID=1159556 RepID=A0A1B5L4Y7_USTVR|nr:hypothetical protein UVI_02061970 [Ustilaginoidea virens]